MSITIIQADAACLPLPDSSVDLVVTSPPYFGLRSYTDAGAHMPGQIGGEPTPARFIDALITCTAEWLRVLKPSGSIFVNLGDSYYSGKGAPGGVGAKNAGRAARRAGGNALDGPFFGIQRKSLCLLPERYRVAAVDQLGLIARAVIVWDKPNPLPESVTDRVRRSHEDWVHLVKQPDYYSALDTIRVDPADTSAHAASRRSRPDARLSAVSAGQTSTANPLGKLPGSVWRIAGQPLKVPPELNVAHFAAFPMAWPQRIIRGWSPEHVCTACGQGRRPLVDTPGTGKCNNDDPGHRRSAVGLRGADWDADREANPRTITGWTCACPDTSAASTPGVVLDPFGGTGTTALVADVLGREGVTVDLSGDYCRLAQWRTTDPKQRARAARFT